MSVFSKYKAAYGPFLQTEMRWDIALRDTETDNIWKMVPMLSDRYWGADPFLWRYESKLYLFYERYDCRRGIGELAVREVNKDLTTGREYCILSRPYHLSFPHVFQYRGQLFLIPETSAHHSIEVYRAVSFPYQWELYKTIVSDISAVDTIVFSKQAEGIVLLTSFTQQDSCRVENWLLYLDKDFNFIKQEKYKDRSDYGNRNAGQILQRGDHYLRVGQDCRGGEYGRGLVFYQLNPTAETYAFSKEVADFIPIATHYDGVHTYNESGTVQTIDLRYKRKRSFIGKVYFLIQLGKRYVKRRITR